MTTVQLKSFNTAGPCDPLDHYMLPALPRLPEVQRLIDNKKYFLIHAPRQSGKTTSLKAYVDKINDGGKYFALYCSLQELEGISDRAEAMSIILSNLDRYLSNSKIDALR